MLSYHLYVTFIWQFEAPIPISWGIFIYFWHFNTDSTAPDSLRDLKYFVSFFFRWDFSIIYFLKNDATYMPTMVPFHSFHSAPQAFIHIQSIKNFINYNQYSVYIWWQCMYITSICLLICLTYVLAILFSYLCAHVRVTFFLVPFIRAYLTMQSH